MLAGLVMLSLPIAAHLYRRRVRRRQVYPSVALITAVAAGRDGLKNLRRLLLLLLRTCAIVAIIAAFARPVWVGSRASADPLQPHALVIVLDASASTRQIVNGRAVSDRLRAQALEMINRLRVGIDVAAVVFADRAAEAVLPELSLNLPVLTDGLAKSEPGFGGADIVGAFRLCEELLRARTGPVRLVILTDAQATTWEPALRDLAQTPPAFPEQTEIEILTPGGAPPLNVTLVDPVWKPAGLAAGKPAKLEVAIAATTPGGRQAAIERTLRVELNGRPAGGVRLELTPGEWTRLQLELPPLPSGPVNASVAIDADGLDADNRLWAAAYVDERPAIAVVAPPGAHDRPGTSAFYLTRALAPGTASDSPYRVVRMGYDDVSPDALSRCAAVMLVDGAAVRDEAIRALWRYTEGGGLLLGVPPPDLSPRVIAALDLMAGAQGFWPWRQGAPARVAERLDAPAGMSRRAPPALDRLSDESWLALERPVFEMRGDVPEQTLEGEVLLRFASGVPALGRRPAGDGVAVLANFSLDASTSDFATHGVFVALLHELITRLGASSEGEADVKIGEPLRLRIPHAADASVRGPLGTAVSARAAASDDRSLWIEDTGSPGLYEALDGDTPIACGAVNIPSDEGLLEPVSSEELRERVVSAWTRAGAPGTPETLARFAPGGQPIAYIALLVGAVFLFFELLLAAIWRAR